MQDQPKKQRGGFRGGVRPKNAIPKIKKTWGIEAPLLAQIPEKGREAWVNDAIREKINKESEK